MVGYILEHTHIVVSASESNGTSEEEIVGLFVFKESHTDKVYTYLPP
jgi:hypothetical protein